jgi:thymidylate kinase
LWSVFYSSKLSADHLLSIGKRLPVKLFPDGLIYLTCSEEELMNRLMKRPGNQSRLEREKNLMSPLADNKEMQKIIQIYEASESIKGNKILILMNKNLENLHQNAITALDKILQWDSSKLYQR